MSLLVALALSACSDPEPNAVVMAVTTLDAVTNIEVWARDVDDSSAQTWRNEPFEVPRANFVFGDSDVEPLRLRVDLSHGGHWVVRLVGHGAGGTLVQNTGCYTVSGVLEDDEVLLGRVDGNDADADGFPDDEAAYCAMLIAAGASCPGDGVGDCPADDYSTDCNPDDSSVYPLASDTCGNGEDEDCVNGDAACIDCSLPENQGRPECSGDCGACNPPEGCCSGACVDLTSSASNCGACGTSCTDRTDTCEAGVCTCGGGDACGSASTCTAGECVCDDGRGDCDDDPTNGCETDLQFDSEHCGDCTTVCAASCIEGVCN